MLKEKIKFLVTIFQKVIISVLLFFIYYLGFAATLIYMMIFNRKMLRPKNKDYKTYWIDVEGYEPDINDTLLQS